MRSGRDAGSRRYGTSFWRGEVCGNADSGAKSETNELVVLSRLRAGDRRQPFVERYVASQRHDGPLIQRQRPKASL